MDTTSTTKFFREVKQFKIEGQPIGPLRLMYDSVEKKVTATILPEGKGNLSRHGNMHPHMPPATEDGYIDFGPATNDINEAMTHDSSVTVLDYAEHVIVRNYCCQDAYWTISRWNEEAL